MKDIKSNSKELVLFDAFSGIGAIHKSNKRIGMNVKLIGSSEVDPYAIMSYAVIHNLDINNVPVLLEKEMKEYLLKRNIGYDFQKKKSTIQSWKGDKLKRLYQSCIAMKNYGDISIINPNELPDFDLFNFSFCCQDYSVAGKQQGKVDKNGNLLLFVLLYLTNYFRCIVSSCSLAMRISHNCRRYSFTTINPSTLFIGRIYISYLNTLIF